ncbi:MAG: TAT-variant-translocated molybdopterin oxidoreductase [Candidatus Zixiibacteriota bacterium]
MTNRLKNNGKEYWRSLDHLADSPEYIKHVEAEFPDLLPEIQNPVSRRKFLGIMAASMALAGLAGCRRPVEKVIPYVVQPEEIVPGIPKYYATTMPFGSSSFGIVVESHEGRPTKIEGNKLHPSTLGSSNVWMQAEILNLYDPDRSKKVLNNMAGSSWDEFVSYWRKKREESVLNKGEGLAILTEPFASPTMARLQKEFIRKFPKAKIVAYEPIGNENIYRGIQKAFNTNKTYRPDYLYDEAKVILSFDSDFLLTESESVLAAKRFSKGRDVTGGQDDINRLYMIESSFTSTGAMADHRLRLSRQLIEHYVTGLYFELKDRGIEIKLNGFLMKIPVDSWDDDWLGAVAEDLIGNRGHSLVIGGQTLSQNTHELIAAINDELGNTNKTATYYPADDVKISDAGDYQSLIDDSISGKIDTLIILGGNPVYHTPEFSDVISRVPNTVHLSSHINETSQNVTWHIHRAHFLEYWGDASAINGTKSIIQPLIEPLFGGKSDIEVFTTIIDGTDRRGYEIVRETWRDILKSNFEKKWRRVLHDGVLTDSQNKPEKLKNAEVSSIIGFDTEHSVNSLELTFNISPAVYDGRYANNGWLQELPHPISKLTWGNAVYLSPKSASELDVTNGDIIKIDANNESIELPIWILPGQPDYSIAVEVGYGRSHAGRVGNGVGVNIYGMRKFGQLDYINGVKVSKTGKVYPLASTQDHGSMEGRPLVREANLDEYKHNPDFAKDAESHPPLRNIYPEHDYSAGYQWGMTIDLSKCIGCNVCTIACQSENNIPVVGKEQVGNGREMHWIRLDRYFTGDTEDPKALFQPVACQHCENAPCEQVCPVQATSHDKEGLNVMTYNRCVGTRYCSNNCPYKVRRFNFFNYTSKTPEIVKMAMNPDVTVRFRGVMEKCTFCTQRINRGKISARKEGRELSDGEIVSACQQACPTEAITFGNINDPESAVALKKKDNLNYELLAELNVRPRNSYLARVRNPNPKLVGYKTNRGQ